MQNGYVKIGNTNARVRTMPQAHMLSKTTKNLAMRTICIITPRVINRQTFRPFVYTLYIDESGDPGKYKADNKIIPRSSKHFTLAGIIVQDRMIHSINVRIQNLIQKYFKSTPLNEKLHCYPLAQNLSPYNQLPPGDGLRLMNGAFEIICDSPCWLLSATINLEKYFTKGYPYENSKAFAMLLMLERFQRFLGLNNSAGNAIYESFGSGERRRIKRTVSALYGPLHIQHYDDINQILSRMQDGDPIKEPILQLADFCAYAIFTKHESDCHKYDRWNSIKQKYFELDSGYYTSGNVYR